MENAGNITTKAFFSLSIITTRQTRTSDQKQRHRVLLIGDSESCAWRQSWPSGFDGIRNPELRVCLTCGIHNRYLAFFQLLTAMGFLLPAKSHSQTGLVLTEMYLFSAFYSPGQGPVPFVYSAESMPLYVRDLGMSMATATLWFFNFLLAVTFPRFQYSFGNAGAFGYYAAWCTVGWFMILVFVPETKNLTLEQLDARFSIPTKTHARWALKEVMFVIQYYLFGRKGANRPILSVSTGKEAQSDMRRLPPRKLSM